ncbi:toxin-antitoxin system HicB family antitoxin [Pseudonocardia abyssalis]|uniref:Toxin-antitoxin system HicB family antitoxin n=1 Tax=Pseudonocardia abyssalis TaxID=2792008 RepID=A0ABS6UTR6_9PSEU|nr:toxin-antitoxin system HicB family antitoxin [Pseudonocardia abyssalis]MBW0115333.1 toxin-antitoxin system HicB family antitoxin [Pseudonocardia abyssalis]MBW0135653.1 toxin-antitoxin system HicB family antitoxin [Pseudonocardia abyssalis]
MDLTPYVDGLRRELAVAAEAGGDDARALAERLTAALAPAVRLTLLDALSAAAAEITRDLAPGSVDLRLRGREPSFVVATPDGAAVAPEMAPPEPAAADPVDDGTTARINFRLPEHLKVRIEAAAAAEGLSVNAWLVRAAGAAVEPDRRHTQRGGRRYTGWVR